MKRSRLPAMMLAVVSAMFVVLASLGIGSAAAQTADDDDTKGAPVPARVTSVDALGSTVEVAVFGVENDVPTAAVSVVEEGEEVAVRSVASTADLARQTEIVLVIDTNARSAQGEVLERVRTALSSYVEQLPDSTKVALISAGDSVIVKTKLTDDREHLLAEIDDLTMKGGSALYNGLTRAGQLFTTEPGLVRSVVVFSTGPDVGSDVTLIEAQVGIVQRGAQVVAVHYSRGDGPLASSAIETAGVQLLAESPNTIESAMDRALTLAGDRLLVSFDGSSESGSRGDVVLALGDATAEFSYPAGVLSTNPLQLSPEADPVSSGFALFNGSVGLYIAIGLAFVGITLGVWSIGSIATGSDASLEGMLSRYTDGSAEVDDADVEELIVQSALLQRAVTFSESFAEKRGFLARVEDLLERANLPVRAGEAMFMLAAITVLSAGFGLVLTKSFVAAFLLGFAATGISFFIVRFLGRRRFKTFERQLPDTLQLLAGTLRAGYSLPQGLEASPTRSPIPWARSSAGDDRGPPRSRPRGCPERSG